MFPIALFFCVSILGKSDAVLYTDIDAWRWSVSLDSYLNLTTTVDLKSEELTFSLKLNVTKNESNHGVRVGISPEAKITNGSHFVTAWTNSTSGDWKWQEFFRVNDTNMENEDDKRVWKNVSLNSTDHSTWYEIRVSLERPFVVKSDSLGMEIKDENIYLIWGYGIMNETNNWTMEDVTEGSMAINLLKFPVPGSATISQPIKSIFLSGIALFLVLFSSNFCN